MKNTPKICMSLSFIIIIIVEIVYLLVYRRNFFGRNKDANKSGIVEAVMVCSLFVYLTKCIITVIIHKNVIELILFIAIS